VHIFYFHVTCEARLSCTASFLSYWSTFAQTLNNIDHNPPWRANIHRFLLSFLLLLLLLLLVLLILLLLLLQAFHSFFHSFIHETWLLLHLPSISLDPEYMSTASKHKYLQMFFSSTSHSVAGHLQVQYRSVCGSLDPALQLSQPIQPFCSLHI